MSKDCGASKIDDAQAGEQRKIRRSRAGLPRTIALLVVQALMAVHIAHWASTGRTVSPLEPSEGMEFGKSGVVNAGLIFFGLTIASTLVLGRWFCGWACHVVALQDASRWLLLKLRIRPRLVNLGVLGVVPWIAFVYMFLAPLVQRLLIGHEIGVRGVHLTTTSFWATFPSWPVALLTLAFCGFAVVYFLGAKGFCTYGCPYGAIFGVADQLAPVRIRVRDTCEGCGHCTAVCTSNVRVHQEVRDWGMVVDSGCMKCLDCVSVCPTNSLYVGAGAPALFAKKRPGATPQAGAKPDSAATSRADKIGRAVLLAAFLFAAFAVFCSYDGPLDVRLALVLTAASFVVAQVFRGKARRKSEYALGEEVLLAILFLLSMLAFRGYRGSVPFLFALGLSASLAYLTVQWLRTLYARDVAVQKHALRRAGRWTRGGAIFTAVMVPVVVLWFTAGAEQVRARENAAHAQHLFEEGVHASNANRFAEAVDLLRRALAIDPSRADVRASLGSLLCSAGRYSEGIGVLEEAHALRPNDTDILVTLARAYAVIQDAAHAKEHMEHAVAVAPGRAELHYAYALLCEQLRDAECARAQYAEVERLQPGFEP